MSQVASLEDSLLFARLFDHDHDREAAAPTPSDRQFAWVDGVPVACAVARLSGQSVELLRANAEYHALLLDSGREGRLDHGALCNHILDMQRTGLNSFSFSWFPADTLTIRRLDITIRRLEEEEGMFVLSVQDRTGEILGQLNLRREMMFDSLTGFANRTGFEEQIDEILAEGQNGLCALPCTRFAIVMIDLARFSQINQCIGALAGDEMIITAARRIRSAVRDGDVLARLGGNEFGLFVRLTEDEGNARDVLTQLVERVRAAFVLPCRMSDLEIQIECAFGAATGAAGRDEPMDIVRHAQIALKRAKASGRFELYSRAADDRVRRRFSLETDLRRAMANGELQLRYQPFLSLESRQVAGFEALARWRHPDMGEISPVEFIAVAEESGLIVPLGRWAMEEAARAVAGWNKAEGGKVPFRVAVNLSAHQLLRDDIGGATEAALNGAGIAGDQFAIELTESAFVADPQGTIRTMDRLRDMGIRIALDDFGTGYSNLAYLQRLPLDVLKIDRSFITGMSQSPDKRAIVDTILSLARSFDISCTAEGIESSDLAHLLHELGCNYGQGFFYAKAIPAEDAYAFYRSLLVTAPK